MIPNIYISVQVFDDKSYLAEAKSCAEVIWSRGLLRKGYGICHGVSGNAYGFLALYKATLEPMYLYRAWKVLKNTKSFMSTGFD